MIKEARSVYRSYTAALRRITVGIACGIVFAGAPQSPASAQTSPKVAAGKTAVEKAGLHFLFDASGSMCGYLRANDPAKALLTIIKRATALKDNEKNNKVMLVRQVSASANAARDIVEAPGNFQALADYATADLKAKCAPFDGVDSNVELIFSTKSASVNARSLVLVSDMQLEEKAQISFVDQFRVWARAQGQQSVSAGVVTLRAPFAGSYYPVADTDPAKRQSGYALPTHDRPISLMWFAAGQEDIVTVRNLLTELGLMGAAVSANFAYGLQVLPIRTEQRVLWLQAGDPLVSAAALFGQPKIEVKAPNTDRRPEILHACAAARIQGNEITVRAGKKCRDEKPFFEVVSGLDVMFPIKVERGVTILPDATIATVKGSTLILSFSRNTPAATNVGLTLSALVGDLTTARMTSLTLDNDACVVSTGRSTPKDAATTEDSWEKRCVEKLTGKVYRYDAFVQQFASRAKMVMDEQLSAIRLNLKVVFER